MSKREPQGEGPHLAIKESSSVDEAPCVLCGQLAHPFAGPDLFLADSWDLVCWNCGVTYAPALVLMLGEYWNLDEPPEDESRVTLSA